MELKIKFNNARKKLQACFKPEILSFQTTELSTGIKTEILVNGRIISVGYSNYSINKSKDYLDSMLDAIENYDCDFVE